MKKGISKFTAFCVAAGMTLGGPTIVSYATGTELPLVGVKGAGSQSVNTSEKAGDASQQTAEAVQETEETVTEEYRTVSTEPADTSMVGTRGFAKCSEYVNIRAAADTENGEVIGKLRNNAAVYIEDVTADGWYKVSSGNVEGYVAAQYIATGAQAEVTAQEAGYHVAEVGAEVLNVRSSADTGSDIVAVVGNSEHIEVVEDCGEWLKVAVDANTYGYVSADYVYAETQYAQAESIEEEQARLNAEYEAYLAQQAAAQQAAAQQQYTYVETYNDYSAGDYTVYTEPAADASYGASSNAQAAADAAYQEYLNAQAAADAATMQADVQAVYDTAQAAQEKYAEYLTVQAAADAQAAGGSYTETQQTYTETYADQTYYDTASSGSQATADALYQEYLDAQAAADAATTQADEQVVYDTAREAQEKYAEYLAAQTAADEAAVNGGSAEITAPDVYAEEYSEEVYSEDTYYEEEYSEEEYVEDGDYVEEYVEDTASYSSTGSEIASFACQFVGNPYVWGGTSLTNGADCSGFTQSVMAHFGIGISRTAASQSGGGTSVDLGSIQPGDLLFYNGDGGIGHVSIYIGNGQVVHASNSTSGIIISDYSYRSPCCARRYW